MKDICNVKGFTIIELMTVMAIIGLLASLAIPMFLDYQTSAKQSEAKIILRNIFTNEQTYFSENNTFSSDFNDIQLSLSGDPKFFDFTISDEWGTNPAVWMGAHGRCLATSGPAVASFPFIGSDVVPGSTQIEFTALATGNLDGDPPFDEWTITQNGDLQNTVNDRLLESMAP